MTPTEAVKLTGYIQAHFPSQPINDYTPDALSELLHHYPFADCRAAVLAISTRGSERGAWCSPSDVAAEVRRIRTKRLNDNPLPPPPPDLTPLQTIEWQKAATKRTADGEQVQMTGYGELEERNMPDLRALIQRRPVRPDPNPLPPLRDHSPESNPDDLGETA